MALLSTSSASVYVEMRVLAFLLLFLFRNSFILSISFGPCILSSVRSALRIKASEMPPV